MPSCIMYSLSEGHVTYFIFYSPNVRVWSWARFKFAVHHCIRCGDYKDNVKNEEYESTVTYICVFSLEN